MSVGARPGVDAFVTPAPRLASSGELELPGDCPPVPGMVYRKACTAKPDGHVTGTESTPGDGCVQDALGRWVSTYRYRPREAPVAQALDWMLVTASSGR